MKKIFDLSIKAEVFGRLTSQPSVDGRARVRAELLKPGEAGPWNVDRLAEVNALALCAESDYRCLALHVDRMFPHLSEAVIEVDYCRFPNDNSN